MNPLAFLLALILVLAPALAEADKLAQIPVLPAASGPHPDLDALLQRFWRDYYKADGSLGFDMSQVRVGRVALTDDDNDELILMIASQAWRTDAGYPFVIATWIDKEWVAVGWGWGDEDGIFSLTETRRGWHSVETGTYVMRWNGTEYERETKSTAPPVPAN